MAEDIRIVAPTQLVKLDLACGQSPREGFEGVDFLAPDVKHRVDLFKFPWPWADNSVDELHSSHFVEHLPCREVEEHDLAVVASQKRTGAYLDPAEDIAKFVGKDFLFAFFDECWRILKHGGTMKVIVPCGRSNRGFQDPTHRRFLVAETFGYLNREWRKGNKLDHYKVDCHFLSNVVPTVPTEMTLLHPEAQARRFNESWNVIFDWVVDLQAVKP